MRVLIFVDGNMIWMSITFAMYHPQLHLETHLLRNGHFKQKSDCFCECTHFSGCTLFSCGLQLLHESHGNVSAPRTWARALAKIVQLPYAWPQMHQRLNAQRPDSSWRCPSQNQIFPRGDGKPATWCACEPTWSGVDPCCKTHRPFRWSCSGQLSIAETSNHHQSWSFACVRRVGKWQFWYGGFNDDHSIIMPYITSVTFHLMSLIMPLCLDDHGLWIVSLPSLSSPCQRTKSSRKKSDIHLQQFEFWPSAT